MNPMYSGHYTFEQPTNQNTGPTLERVGPMFTFADCKGGFPHSEITGSKGASASPVLIAACHVLHRLSTPRHPSEALQRLIVSQQNSCLVYSARLERCRGTKPDFCQTMSSSRTRPKSSGEPVTFFLYDINARHHAVTSNS
jgi:hypothetical protein